MKSAVLYKRVSTDEQAFGFSLDDQDKRLTEYCQKNSIQIAGSFKDDFTGKTFNRPGFNELLALLKKSERCRPVHDLKLAARLCASTVEGDKRGETRTFFSKPDFLLFTKWSRFSRNTAESYQMIKQIRAMGIEVQAIDEPLDLSIPQNLILQAIHLATPEMDNLIRSDNTQRGMRRAMKSGRYVSTAPQGYINSRDAQNKPILTIDPDKAPLIKKMFDLMATGSYSQQEVRRMINSEGLNYARTKFKNALMNHIYIGKIRLEAYKSEPEEIVHGIHEPIIPESTFYRVQAVLSGKKRIRITNNLSEEMPLRGFLYCQVDHKLTGSCSHGHGGKYHYYHCPNVLCERHRADAVNQAYERLLESYKLDKEWAEVIEEASTALLKPDATITATLEQQIKAQTQRIQVLQDKFVDGLVSASDYQTIRVRYESNLFDLKAKLSDLTQAESDLNANFGNAMNLLTYLPDLYRQSDLKAKRDIIGSITPGKLYFENKKVRTSEINEGIRLICTISKDFSQSHTLRKVQFDSNVPSGSPQGTVVRTLSSDLLLLSDLFKRVA